MVHTNIGTFLWRLKRERQRGTCVERRTGTFYMSGEGVSATLELWRLSKIKKRVKRVAIISVEVWPSGV